jgi:hypothetical protein
MWLLIKYVSQYFAGDSILSFGNTPSLERTQNLEEGRGIHGEKKGLDFVFGDLSTLIVRPTSISSRTLCAVLGLRTNSLLSMLVPFEVSLDRSIAIFWDPIRVRDFHCQTDLDIRPPADSHSHSTIDAYHLQRLLYHRTSCLKSKLCRSRLLILCWFSPHQDQGPLSPILDIGKTIGQEPCLLIIERQTCVRFQVLSGWMLSLQPKDPFKRAVLVKD